MSPASASSPEHSRHNRVLILDYGSQYTRLIARRVREAGIYSEVRLPDWPEESIQQFNAAAVILSGGPASTSHGAPIPGCLLTDDAAPILGICYGMQAMAAQLGGSVRPGNRREYGPAYVRARGHSSLLRDIQDETNDQGHGLLKAWMSHGDHVDALPTGFKIIASTEGNPIAGIADEKQARYGLQFHPEVTHTTQGKVILERFLYDIAGCVPDWNTPHISDSIQKQISEHVKPKEKVLLALSGGVDSGVVAALLHRIIGDRLIAVFVDHGFLREGETEEVMRLYGEQMNINLHRIDASDRFMAKLAGVADPEEKRRIIGHTFIEVFEEEAEKITGATYLAQGTIYPDVIESAADGSGANKIKSHHNVGGLPDALRLPLLEPLRHLFKDEVRRLGAHLGLPDHLLHRHPFPGPGLAIRVLGTVRPEYLKPLRQADAIFMEELREHKWYDRLDQAFAVFLPVRTVGVQGDGRCYEHVISLRAIQTTDYMTAHWADLPRDLLDTVATRIINEVPNIARVVYDISNKPPATIEWE